MGSMVNSCHKALTGVLCKQHHLWLFLLFTGFLSLSFLFWVVLPVSSCIYLFLPHQPFLASDLLPVILAQILCLCGPFSDSSGLTREMTKSLEAFCPASSRCRPISLVPPSVSSQPAAEAGHGEVFDRP